MSNHSAAPSSWRQAERLWRDPKTTKARKKLVKNLCAKAQDLASRRG